MPRSGDLKVSHFVTIHDPDISKAYAGHCLSAYDSSLDGQGECNEKAKRTRPSSASRQVSVLTISFFISSYVGPT